MSEGPLISGKVINQQLGLAREGKTEDIKTNIPLSEVNQKLDLNSPMANLVTSNSILTLAESCKNLRIVFKSIIFNQIKL